MKKKNAKKVIIIICSVVLTFSLLFCGVGGVLAYILYAHTNVFDFLKTQEEVSSVGVGGSYQEDLSDASVADETDIKRADALYGAILENKSITDAEKDQLAKYYQYFVDNKYMQTERVAKKLSGFTITENDPSLLDMAISAEYKSENEITFATDEERAYALSHELHHCMESEELSYEFYGWFGEGMACLVNYEYFDMDSESYNLQTFFVRGLCEIAGPDALFEVSATGNMDVLITALIESGVSEEMVTEAFDLFTELKDIDSNLKEITIEQRIDAIEILVDMYRAANNDTGDIPSSLYGAAEDFIGMSETPLDYYYLNSTKRQKSEEQQSYISRATLQRFYFEARCWYNF